MSTSMSVGFRLLIVMAMAGSALLSAPLSFSDDFSGPALDPAWNIKPGTGTYSLSANPGNLRMQVTGSTHPSGDNPSVWLYREFSGAEWTLDTFVDYTMGSGNGRQITTRVIFGDILDKGFNEINWYRTKDNLGGGGEGNVPTVYIDGGAHVAGSVIGLSPSDSYYFRVTRSGQHVELLHSQDGSSYTLALQHDYVTPLGNDQLVFLSVSSFASGQLAYGDFDYINVEGVPEPGTFGLLAAGLLSVIAFRKRRG
ncbi:MAG: PEP-CTERM sorting domain-containing protein [Acidobacteria bacterium]|nr:PEP-CTERM sorting domain-containing protein [Acidobacteriota bacterium]